MPDGSKWDVPVHLIAHDRAKYYGDNSNPEDSYDDEYAFAIDNEEVLQDWAENNMDWSDVRPQAIKVEAASEVDYDDGWVNGEKDFVEY